ncbi:hypothetical protein CNR22_22285 [Sphingobacteriaceae bacterium]|nr:hypothetical protein CNR22_22285 [Sphingobacteriaceae bacterium]
MVNFSFVLKWIWPTGIRKKGVVYKQARRLKNSGLFYVAILASCINAEVITHDVADCKGINATKNKKSEIKHTQLENLPNGIYVLSAFEKKSKELI